MKNKLKKPVAAALAIAAAAVMTGCGRASGPETPVYIPPNVPGTQVPGLPAGCIPITGPIGFTANNIYFDSSNVVAGGQYGQVLLGQGGGSGPVTNGQGPGGTISMNVTPINVQNVNGRPISQWANASGTLQLSPLAQQNIQSQFTVRMGYSGGYAGGYGGYYPQQPAYQQQQPCVSGLAFAAKHYNNTLYQVNVYLMINNAFSVELPF